MSDILVHDRAVKEQPREPRESLAARVLGPAVEGLLMTHPSACARVGNELADVTKALREMNPSELFRSVSTLAADVATSAISPMGTAAQLGLEAAKNYYDHKKQDAFLSNLSKHDVNYQGPTKAMFEPEQFNPIERLRVREAPKGAYIYEKEYMQRLPKDNRAWTPQISEELLRSLKDK